MGQLEQAIELVRLGDKEQAREILKNILRADKNNETAWLYMTSCVKTKGEFRRCVREVLRLNPENEIALELAEKHNIDIPSADMSDAEFYAEDITQLTAKTDILPRMPAIDAPTEQEIESELELILDEEALFAEDAPDLSQTDIDLLFDDDDAEFDGELVIQDEITFADDAIATTDLFSAEEQSLEEQFKEVLQEKPALSRSNTSRFDLDDIFTDENLDEKVKPLSQPTPKARRGRACLGLLLFLALLAVVAGGITFVFLNVNQQQEDDLATRTAQSAEIAATNSALENEIIQTATIVQETLSAPTITPTIDYTATVHITETSQAEMTQAAEATQLAITPTLPPVHIQNGQIALVQYEDENAEILVLNNIVDTEPTNLTNNPAVDEMPRWSPDGQWLTFVSNRNGSKDIFVMRRDGSDLRQLTDASAEDLYPAWSPDSTHLVFASNRDGDFDLFIIDVEQTEIAVKLTDNEAFDSFPHWSLDNHLVFASNRDGNFEIYKMDTDGQNLQRMTENDADDFYPVWSPSSQQIVFISQTADGREIHSIQADGTNLIALTSTQADEFSPAWSPDGNFVLFAAEDKGNTDIYLMRPDGSDYSKVREGALPLDSPAWAIATE